MSCVHTNPGCLALSFMPGFRFKMKPQKYTAKQIDEVIDRGTALRMRCFSL